MSVYFQGQETRKQILYFKIDMPSTWIIDSGMIRNSVNIGTVWVLTKNMFSVLLLFLSCFTGINASFWLSLHIGVY